MAVKTRATFKTDKNAAIAVGVPNNITAQELRDLFDDVVDSPVFPEDSTYSTAVSQAAAATAAINGKTLLKHNSTTTNPTVSNDGTQGYAVNSRWTNTTTDKTFVCVDSSTGAAIWQEVALQASLANIARTGSFADLLDDPFGDIIGSNQIDFIKPTQQAIYTWPIEGDINRARPGVAPGVKVLWTGTNGVPPTNMQDGDLYEGPLYLARPYVVVNSNLSLTVDVSGYDLWCTNTAGIRITGPNNTTSAMPLSNPQRILRLGTGAVSFTAQSGATLNGLTGAIFEIDDQFGQIEIDKYGTNSWRMSLYGVTQGVSLSTIKITAGTYSYTTVGSDYVITIPGGTGGASGDIEITGADLEVRTRETAPGGGGGRSGSAGGGAGGESKAQAALVLPAGTYPWSIGARGVGATSNGDGTAGGNLTVFGNTRLGGVGGAGGASSTAKVGNNGFNGSGAQATTTTAGGATTAGGTATTGGYAGGLSGNNNSGTLRGAGGGGGSGGAGGNGNGTNGTGGDAGLGALDNIDGTSRRYGPGGAAGGGTTNGAADPNAHHGEGGAGSGVSRANGLDGVQGSIIIRVPIASLTGVPADI